MKFLLKFLPLLFLLSCIWMNKSFGQCGAGFSYANSGLTCAFSNFSKIKNARFYWSFGDGSYDTLTTNPSHKYAKTGKYTVCLRALDTISGCTDSVCNAVSVTGRTASACSFSGYYGYTVSGTVYFTSNALKCGSCTSVWDYGDGTPFDTGASASHTYAKGGKYTACVIIYDSSGTKPCIDTSCQRITVKDCQADFSLSLKGTRADFTNNSYTTSGAAKYSWDFGDGTKDTAFSPSHRYGGAGPFNACLYLYDSAAGCRDTLCQSLYFKVSCFADFVYSASNDSVQFTDTSGPGYIYEWDFGDGDTSSQRNPLHIYAKSGKYAACLTITDSFGKCSSSKCETLFITVPARCLAAWTYSVSGKAASFFDTVPLPSGSKRLWRFGDGSSSSLRNPKHTYAKDSAYVVCLIHSDSAGGCDDMLCKSVSIGGATRCVAGFKWNDLQITSTIRKIAFRADTLSNAKGAYYLWSFGDGGTGVGDTISHVFRKSAGKTAVCLRVLNGTCSALQCDSIDLTPTLLLPPVSAVRKPVHCFPNPVHDKLFLDLSGVQGELRICLQSLLGQKFLSGSVMGGGLRELNLGGIPKGIYFLQISNRNGEALLPLKIVKE